jgi:hypothetical protein
MTAIKHRDESGRTEFDCCQGRELGVRQFLAIFSDAAFLLRSFHGKLPQRNIQRSFKATF